MSDSENPLPYADTRHHLLDELVRIELLLRRHVETLWNDPGGQPDIGGFYVSAEEVDHLLATRPLDGDGDRVPGHDHATTSGPEAHSRDGPLDAHRQSIHRRVSRSRDAGVDLRLIALSREFGLSSLEVDVLLLALTPDLDRKYERIYGYLRDDITNTRPTVELLLQVLADSAADRLALLELFATQSTLVREGLLLISDGATIPCSTVRVHRRVLEYLLGSDAIADPIGDAATLVDPDPAGDGRGESLADLTIDEEKRRTLTALTDRLGHRRRPETAPGRDDPPTGAAATLSDSAGRDRDPHGGTAAPESEHADRPLIAAFVGPDERTADVAVAAVCRAAALPVLRVDARALPHDGLEDVLAIVRLEARLQHAAIHVSGIGALEFDSTRQTDATTEPPARSPLVDHGLEPLIAGLDASVGDVFLTGDADVSARLQPRLDGHDITRIGFPRPAFEVRQPLWADVDGLPADVDPTALAGTYRLTRGEIEDAVATARSLADGALTPASIREACRLHSRGDLDDLAVEVEPTYDWDDIVLPPDTLTHLREIAAGIRHRGTVYEAWGFADRFSLGNGINVLFTGPSGTGKTMAAEIIAGDVELPLYKLDLAQILSKYIGETEANLGRIFDAAEQSNAILFFDEADALFGKRTEISDSHDRYANVEVDYLLQRMEEHDGCVIMASNLKENIDEAFRRRINATVAFSMPDAAAREEIWRTIFPEALPRGDIDAAFLARFEFSGGFIKNVALTAAFLAADEGGPLEMTHVMRALRREYQKTGKLLDLDEFGDYRDLVE